MNEQTKKLNNCESEVSELRTKMEFVKKQLEEKERKLLQKDRELLELQSSMITKDHNTAEEETTEILALKVYIYCFQISLCAPRWPKKCSQFVIILTVHLFYVKSSRMSKII